MAKTFITLVVETDNEMPESTVRVLAAYAVAALGVVVHKDQMLQDERLRSLAAEWEDQKEPLAITDF